jgi:hypothetical protein
MLGMTKKNLQVKNLCQDLEKFSNSVIKLNLVGQI